MFDGKEYVYAVYEEKSFSKAAAETVYYAAGVKHGDQEGGEKDRNSDF